MMILFAHHLESHHVGIAAVLFLTGSIIGWWGCTRWIGADAGERSSS